jgi:hypothetical protein
MAKYVLTPTGEVKKYNVPSGASSDWNISETRLPNKLNKEDARNSNKFSEFTLGGGLLFSPDTFSPPENILDQPVNNVINSSAKLVHPSFGFESGISSKEFYNSYNTVFDLDLENFNNSDGVQIFANNLEFFGFPQFTMSPVRTATEALYVVTTIVDMTIFALIPIATITLLQQLIQNENSNPLDQLADIFGLGSKKKDKPKENLFELGQYISYKKFSPDAENTASKIGAAFLDVAIQTLKNILNSFERIMNFPKFKFPDSDGLIEAVKNTVIEIGQRTLYFVLGYISYLIPGFKLESLDLSTSNIVQNVSDLLTSFITSNSSRHNFNFLIRKIVRNNHFRNKYLKGEARTSSPDFGFASSFSYFSSFIFRFIGERISVGEKLWRIDSRKSENNVERFNLTRDKSGKLIMREDMIITKGMPTLTIDDHHLGAFQAQKRQDQKTVKDTENLIDRDYMPFTFQDLRDNSIIKSISDSFSSNYNETGGYGRIDKIKNLISTTRSINLSFNIVATSEEDFYITWQKINRLVNMVYPQWTKGTAVREYSMSLIKRDFNKFFQQNGTDGGSTSGIDSSTDPDRLIHTLKIPYSEMPSNSPMIRLRVGNLIRSNYDFQKLELNEIFINNEKKTNNVFLKAFSSNEGLGMAGYITSLGIDWDKETPWETRPYIGKDSDTLGHRPIYSKITIAFAPIHDIPLGLNLDKQLRSKAYYVK